jgi:hypothetical protein
MHEAAGRYFDLGSELLAIAETRRQTHETQPLGRLFRTIQICAKDLPAALRQAEAPGRWRWNKWRYERVCSPDGIALSGGLSWRLRAT